MRGKVTFYNFGGVRSWQRRDAMEDYHCSMTLRVLYSSGTLILTFGYIILYMLALMVLYSDSCEHFHSTTSPSHRFERVSMTLNHGYLRALFNGNQSETFEYEIDCYQKGYGPLSECFRYENASSTTNLCST